MTRFAVVGDGAMGTACALLLQKKPEHVVTLYCQFAGNAVELRQTRENRRYLPGVAIPATIAITADFADVAAADAFVVAVPTVYLAATLAGLASAWPRGKPIVSVVKGIERESFRRPSEIIRQTLGPGDVVVLSGPSHAEEIARGMPASVLAACSELTLATRAQGWFNTDRFRVYTSTDEVGTELAGALKNVIAIAAGICDGLGLGDNAKSALIARGLVEMTRFGVALGAQRETFQGLAGLGDLITTCISPHGRNRKVGELLGQGQSREQILASMNQVAEGVWTAQSVYEIAVRRHLEMPVSTEVYRILYEAKSPLRALDDLMARDARPEADGP